MNKVILIGNLARDPELRTTQGGVAMCRFTVACNRRAPNAQGVREADFITCIAWRERGEFVSRYFTKGRKIAVEGSLQVRSYEAQDGTKRYSTEVLVDNVEFVDSRQSAENASGGYQNDYNAGGYTPPSQQSKPPAQAPADEFVEIDDDELPF